MGRVFWEATEHAACMGESGKALLSVTFEQRLDLKEKKGCGCLGEAPVCLAC